MSVMENGANPETHLAILHVASLFPKTLLSEKVVSKVMEWHKK